MATQYTYHENGNVIVIAISGESSFDERQDVIRRVLADPAIPHGATVLVDVSASRTAPAAAEAAVLPGLIAEFARKGIRRVALVTSQVGHATIAALIAAYVPHDVLECRSFVSVTSAHEWLSRA